MGTRPLRFSGLRIESQASAINSWASLLCSMFWACEGTFGERIIAGRWTSLILGPSTRFESYGDRG